jgi:hypothetical protein
LIKYIKSVLWRVVKRLSYIEDARCLKFKPSPSVGNSTTLLSSNPWPYHCFDLTQLSYCLNMNILAVKDFRLFQNANVRRNSIQICSEFSTKPTTTQRKTSDKNCLMRSRLFAGETRLLTDS